MSYTQITKDRKYADGLKCENIVGHAMVNIRRKFYKKNYVNDCALIRSKGDKRSNRNKET